MNHTRNIYNFYSPRMVETTKNTYNIQEGLAVASIARDDPTTLPGDDPFPRAH